MIISIVLSLCVLSGLLYWLFMAYAGLRVWAVPTLEPSSDRASWPELTVIVPACNEADRLEAAARTLLAQDYPNLRVILVNDRSTDATGQIIDQLAAGDTRVRPIHIANLPERWLGKVHALNVGLCQAASDLVLFTDADVHFAAGALRAAVDFFQTRKLDHLAGFPRLNPSGVVLDAILVSFLRQFVTVMRPWKVSDPLSRAFIGVGAFNLVRREPFMKAGGFEWLCMEIADDAGIGLMMKRAGLACSAARMTEWVSLYWHYTIAQAARGAEKGWSSVCRFSVSKTVILGFVNILLELSPLWTLFVFFPFMKWIGWVGAVVLCLYLFTSMMMSRWMRQRITPHLFSIFIAPVGFVVMVRSAILGWYRGGAVWRGTFYPTQALQEGMRLKFP